MSTNSLEKLACLGGGAVRSASWPSWPRADKNTEKLLLDVLYSGRWAISGMYNGTPLFERRFSEAFAEYHSVLYCTPVVNGSAAITIALEALEIGYGDEVLVPGITWVACASAVLRVGGIPVLVDVDPDTLCMSVDAARSSITSKTKAILLVHLYCSIADIDSFLSISREFNIPIIEDCSQAHGAVFNERRVGSFGRIAVFSMQDGKVLTSGEGGAAITNDVLLYERMQQLRSDGRRYRSDPIVNQIELEEIGMVQGRNLCMSEFHAAILCDRLMHLDEENAVRNKNATYLNQSFNEIGGIKQIKFATKGFTVNTYYQYCGEVDTAIFENVNIKRICQALTSELGILFEPVDSPLNNNILYNPFLSKRLPLEEGFRSLVDPRKYKLNTAVKAAENHFTFPHRALLGSKSDIDSIVDAFLKVKRLSYQLLS